MDRPVLKGREAILKIHTQRIKFGTNVDLKVIAQKTIVFFEDSSKGLDAGAFKIQAVEERLNTFRKAATHAGLLTTERIFGHKST